MDGPGRRQEGTREDRSRWESTGESPGPRFALAALVLVPVLALTAALTPERAALSSLRSPAPTVLAVEPALLAKLQTLADGLHREVVLCLEGRVRRDTAVARDFRMAEPELSSPTRSVFKPCPARTLATWHNHPPQGRRSGPVAASARCVLTETDLRTADRLGYPFAVVAADGTTWCWWTLAQVRAATTAPAPPVPGQGAWSGPAAR